MPIKELHFSFAISVEALAQALATSNTGMKVQVLGTDEPQEPLRANGKERQLALPPPKRSARHLVFAHMRKNPTQSFTTNDLRTFSENFGFNRQSVWNAVHNMKKDGFIYRVAKSNRYRLTKKGLNHA